MLNGRLLDVYSMFIRCSFDFNSTFIWRSIDAYIVNVQSTLIRCSFDVHLTFIWRSFDVHSMFVYCYALFSYWTYSYVNLYENFSICFAEWDGVGEVLDLLERDKQTRSACLAPDPEHHLQLGPPLLDAWVWRRVSAVIQNQVMIWIALKTFIWNLTTYEELGLWIFAEKT